MKALRFVGGEPHPDGLAEATSAVMAKEGPMKTDVTLAWQPLATLDATLYCSYRCAAADGVHHDDLDPLDFESWSELHSGADRCPCGDLLPEVAECECATCRLAVQHPADCPGDCGLGGTEHGADPREAKHLRDEDDKHSPWW